MASPQPVSPQKKMGLEIKVWPLFSEQDGCLGSQMERKKSHVKMMS
jgi:hypothetical protein